MDKLNAWLQEWRTAILDGAARHKGDTVRSVLYMDMLHNLDAVQHWTDQGDTEKAVLWTAAFAQSVQQASKVIELPKLIDEAYSEQQSTIAKKQHGWTEAKQHALDKDMVALSFDHNSPTALYEKCAERIAGMQKTQYRKIWHQASLLYPAVKSPYSK